MIPTITAANDDVIGTSSMNYPAYLAFTEDYQAVLGNGESDLYLGYDFHAPVTVKVIAHTGSLNYPGFGVAQVQGSNDNSVWETIETIDFGSRNKEKPSYFPVENTVSYRSWRVCQTKPGGRIGARILQFLGFYN